VSDLEPYLLVHEGILHQDLEIPQTFHDLDDIQLRFNSFLPLVIELHKLFLALKHAVATEAAHNSREVKLNPVLGLDVNKLVSQDLIFHLLWRRIRDQIFVEVLASASVLEHRFVLSTSEKQPRQSSKVEAVLRN
jgi:hypothetical protein